MDCYIIRSSTGGYTALYHRDGNIYYREKTDDTWTYPEIIGSDARSDFTISTGKEPMAIYQTVGGDIAAGAKNHSPRILLESRENKSIGIHYIPYEDGARLIYSSYGAEGCCIAELHREGKGWSSPSALDSYIPSSAKIVGMGSSNCLLFYIKKAPEFQLGYREITPMNIGGFKMIYASVSSISDYSVAVTDEAVHTAVVTAGRRSGRVLYIRKDSGGISRPITLWEGFAEFTVCGIVNNKLYIRWKNPIGVFSAISYDMGKSFKKPERLNGLSDCRKAGFIMTDNDPDNMVFNDMLVRKDKVYEPIPI